MLVAAQHAHLGLTEDLHDDAPVNAHEEQDGGRRVAAVVLARSRYPSIREKDLLPEGSVGEEHGGDCSDALSENRKS